MTPRHSPPEPTRAAASGAPSFRSRLPGGLSLAVLVGGIALSVLLGGLAQHEQESSAAERFDGIAMELARKVEGRFDDNISVLIGLQAYFNSDREPSRKDFHDYVAGLNLARNYPGFQALNYAAYVRRDDKQRFEARQRADDGFAPATAARFAIRPDGERTDYYPLTLVEPLTGNEQLIGNDLGVMPQRGNALEQSRDTGGLASSGRKIRIGNKPDIGLAMRLPVYRPHLPLETVAQRRAAYIGTVGAGFSVAAMMSDLAPKSPNSLRRLRLVDAGPAPGAAGSRVETRFVPAAPIDENRLLYDSATAADRPGPLPPASPAPRLVRTLAFELAGHAWLLEVSDDRSAVGGRFDQVLPWLITATGAIISALLAGVIYSLSTSRGRAQALALEMTRHLRDSERQLEEAQRLANLGSWTLDPQTGRLECSDEARRILGIDDSSPADITSLLLHVPAEERQTIARSVEEASNLGERREFEHHVRRPDGTERWLHVIVERAEEQGRRLLRGAVRDDTQRRKASLRLKLEHEVAQILLGDGESKAVITQALMVACSRLRWDCAALWRAHDDGRARCTAAWNIHSAPQVEHFVQISRELDYRSDEGSIGRAWREGKPVRLDRLTDLDSFTRDAFAGRAGLAVGLIVPTSNAGNATALEFFSRDPQAADAGAEESLQVIALQIAQYEQRKDAEGRLRFVATHDALTGLRNRASLEREMARAIKRSNRHGMRFAVMFIDLDRFKHINDSLGHTVGDMVIRVCAGRVQAQLREDDTVARFGGDEFVLLMENLSSTADAVTLAQKALACFQDAVVIEGHELHVSASIGVSIFPEDGADAETLIKNADTAMYQAKDKGRGTFRFYASQMNALGAERLALESGLRHAVERGELELHYQPKLDLRTERIVGVEALMRWHHPTLGMVPPARFIPIAEDSGLIDTIGNWALEQACTDAVAWREAGLPALQMSVNLSPRQLGSRALVDRIRGILESTGMPAQQLDFEITEGAMMVNPEHAVKLLEEIRAMGISLAMDDFGTGYSSLSYLRRFPLSTVKIDRSFVNDLPDDADAQALVDSIITLSHGLRMRVVAEGVETPAQLDYLRSRGCDEIQGYLLCRPQPANAIAKFIAQHSGTSFRPLIAA